MISADVIKTESGLRTMIQRNLNKEIHANTTPSINFIYKLLQDAYDSGLKYDVSDMKSAVIDMALSSTNQSDICMKQVSQMKFKSEDSSDFVDSESSDIVFYDVEVFPNLFLVNWKLHGKDNPIVRMINPKPHDIENILKYRLVGFNNRRYDNHMLYACLNGYDNTQIFNLSQEIIEKKRGFFSEAYNLSYTDIYDYCAKKQSVKKWEIELGISHVELGLPWNKPVPEKLWPKVAEYCDHDVIATEAVWDHTQGDFKAREILAKLSGLSVNDTTNSHTTRIIFGKNRKPQSEFNYRFMGGPEPTNGIYEQFDEKGRPIFPGYTFDKNKSYYREFNPENPDPEYREVGEGGVVYAEPGMWSDVALLDVKSMHPSSIVAEQLFGPQYTPIFADILHARLAIKEKRFDDARKMLGGKLREFLDDESLSKDLAQALKIAINSVYGLTAATFDHPFRDPRNLDNIVAKRGALFMINLKHAVEEQGFKVVHIKTDSIKIPNATPEIIDFVMKYGEKYGYEFDHEATYKKMCLVNKAVYIAQYEDGKWTATGTQFAVPYVFKKLFSHEEITFDDLCETKSVTSSIYLDMNEGYPDVTAEEKELQKAEQQFKKGELSDTTFTDICSGLNEKIAKGHNYIFVGKVGRFTPVVDGARGGLLMRLTDSGKYSAVVGTKGYRWLESDILLERNADKPFDTDVDLSYYNDLTDDAWKTMAAYGDVNMFLSDDPMPKPKFVDGKPVYTDLPWD